MENESNDKVIPDGYIVVELETGGWYAVSPAGLAHRTETEQLITEGYFSCKAIVEENIAEIDAAILEVENSSVPEEEAVKTIANLREDKNALLENLANIKLQYGIKD